MAATLFLEAPVCIPLWFPAVPSALQAPGEEMWHTHCAGSTWHGMGPVIIVLITPQRAWHWLQSMAGWFPVLPNSHTAPAHGRASTGATQEGIGGKNHEHCQSDSAGPTASRMLGASPGLHTGAMSILCKGRLVWHLS